MVGVTLFCLLLMHFLCSLCVLCGYFLVYLQYHNHSIRDALDIVFNVVSFLLAGRYAFEALRADAVRTVDELVAAVTQHWPHFTSFRYILCVFVWHFYSFIRDSVIWFEHLVCRFLFRVLSHAYSLFNNLKS